MCDTVYYLKNSFYRFEKNEPRNFYIFLLLRNKYCLIYCFWKKSRNIIRSISPGKRNWNLRLFSFLYSMIENWSSEKMHRFLPIDIVSKLKWNQISRWKWIFSGRVFVLMIVRWHEKIIKIKRMIVSYDFAPRYNVENAARFNRIQLHHLYEHLFSLVQYKNTYI